MNTLVATFMEAGLKVRGGAAQDHQLIRSELRLPGAPTLDLDVKKWIESTQGQK